MASQQAPAADGSRGQQYHGYPTSARAWYDSLELIQPNGRPDWAFPTPPNSTGTSPSLPTPKASSPANRQPPPSIPGFPASLHGFETTGQVAPPGMKPQLTATLWEDEQTLCYQVYAKGICIARREDNHMINGSKLLNVTGMTRGRRDGILKSEKVRHVVKLGPMHLKGVWIPFERALDFANQEKITHLLYPLFVHNIGALLYHPTNAQSKTSEAAKQHSQLPPVSAVTSLDSLMTPPTSVSSVLGDCASPASVAAHSLLPSQRELLQHYSHYSHYSPLSPFWYSDAAHMEPASPSTEGPTATHTAARLPSPIPCPGSPRGGHSDLDLMAVSPISSPEQTPASETGTISSNTASDYTTSSGEDETLLTLADQKRALLKRLMKFFYLIISTRPSPAACIKNCGSGQPQTTSSPASHRSAPQEQHGPSDIPSSSKGTAQKRPRGDEDEDKKNDEDRNNKRLRPSGPGTPADSASPKFACPFFKHNQGRYRTWRGCPGPGWATVHRIKEHVYRKHALPVRCPRCHKVFDTERQKDNHISQEERCTQTEDSSPPEGIDADKTKLLRSRKGKNKEASEVDKWNEMYMILFPEADSTNLPSPYYDYSTESPAPGSPGGEFVRYEQFLRRELPGRVRQELETRIEERLNPMEETLRGELVEIVRDMQLQLFELYKASRNPEPESEQEVVSSDAAPNPQEPQEQEATTQPAQTASAAEDMGPLEAFVQPPLINSEDWTSFGDFDGQIWDPSMLDSRTLWAGDSGYDSLPPNQTQDGYFTKFLEKDWGLDGDAEL